MSLPTGPKDAVAKANRAISNVLMGSDEKPIEEEVEINFKDPDKRPVSSFRPTVQLLVDISGDTGGGTRGLGVESSMGSSDESSEDSRAYCRCRRRKKHPHCSHRRSRGGQEIQWNYWCFGCGIY